MWDIDPEVRKGFILSNKSEVCQGAKIQAATLDFPWPWLTDLQHGGGNGNPLQ